MFWKYEREFGSSVTPWNLHMIEIHFCGPVTPEDAGAPKDGFCAEVIDVTRNAAGPPCALGAPDQAPSTVIRFRSSARMPPAFPAEFAAESANTSGTDLPSSVASIGISFATLPSRLSPRRIVNQPERDTVPPCWAYTEDTSPGLRVVMSTLAIKRNIAILLRDRAISYRAFKDSSCTGHHEMSNFLCLALMIELRNVERLIHDILGREKVTGTVVSARKKDEYHANCTSGQV